LKEVDIENVVLKGWNKKVKSRRSDCRFRDKLKNVKFELKEWSRKRFGGLNEKINEYNKEAMRWELEAESKALDDEERLKWLEARNLWIGKEMEKTYMLR
ncbi:hypothetical protein Tco_0137507, partial [Tanacetum coccineum]